MTVIEMTHVPYKESPPALVDLLAGRVPLIAPGAEWTFMPITSCVEAKFFQAEISFSAPVKRKIPSRTIVCTISGCGLNA